MASCPGFKSGIPVYTQCQLQNQSGNNYHLKLDSQNHWHGYGDPSRTIQDGFSGNFRHNADPAGSIGGVAYVLVTDDQKDILKWLIAWSNSEGKPNKVYTQILAANTVVDWSLIKIELENSGNENSDLHKYEYSSQVVIDQYSPVPKVIATLKKPDSGPIVPAYTQCELQNHAGYYHYAKLDSQNSWHGNCNLPTMIQDQSNGNFRHNSDAEGSIAGVAYILVVNNQDVLKWVIAWSNLRGMVNKVYTEILPANAVVDWEKVKIDVENSMKESKDLNKYGYASIVEIDQHGDMPQLMATLRKGYY